MLPLWHELPAGLHDVLPVANKTADQTLQDQRKQHGGKSGVRRKNNDKFGDMALDGEESTPVPNLALEAIVKPALREVIS